MQKGVSFETPFCEFTMERGLVAAAVSAIAVSAATTAAATIATATAATASAAATITATATAATATIAAAATAALRTVFTRTRFVDLDGATVHVLAMEFADGCIGFLIGGESDETETARAAGLTIDGNHDVGHGATLTEGVAQRVFGGAEGEIPHIEFVTHTIIFFIVFICQAPSRPVPAQTPTNVKLNPGGAF
jgi:uncharacterized cupredoxin-like copper-binding protein